MVEKSISNITYHYPNLQKIQGWLNSRIWDEQQGYEPVKEHSANEYFCKKYLNIAKEYGMPFLEKYWIYDSDVHYEPVHLNCDFFAAVLRGEERLGLRMVYYRPDNTFYYYEYKIGIYEATTPDRIKLLLRHYLNVSLQELNLFFMSVEPLSTTFQQDKVLDEVVERAKVILEVDKSFFAAGSGNIRPKDDQVVKEVATPETFVSESLQAAPESSVTMTDLYEAHLEYCSIHAKETIPRNAFKSEVTKAMDKVYKLRPRHDIKDSEGRCHRGWKGIKLANQPGEDEFGQSDASEESGKVLVAA